MPNGEEDDPSLLFRKRKKRLANNDSGKRIFRNREERMLVGAGVKLDEVETEMSTL